MCICEKEYDCGFSYRYGVLVLVPGAGAGAGADADASGAGAAQMLPQPPPPPYWLNAQPRAKPTFELTSPCCRTPPFSCRRAGPTCGSPSSMLSHTRLAPGTRTHQPG